MQQRYRLLASAAAGLLILSPSTFSQSESHDRLTAPIITAQRTMTNAVHPLAAPKSDLGRVPGAQVFRRMVLLLQHSSAQESDLEQLLNAQQDPKSPQYHRWLTPAEFGQRFGPSANDMAKIAVWLQSQGFTVEAPPHGRQFLLFTGTSAQVESAFQTEMHRYLLNGKTHIANAKPASIPAALAPAVAGVASLNSFSRWAPQYKAQYHLAANISKAVVLPSDLAVIYNATPLQQANVLGQGQSIALIEESNISVQDVADFRRVTGLPPATVNVIVNGPDPGLVGGEEMEAIADVEYAGALAPNATLNVIVSASTDFNQGIDLSTAYAVDNHISPITSLSYGGCETVGNTYRPSSVALYNEIYRQGAAEGISHFVSAGDWGGDTCRFGAGYGVNVLADSPWVVSVGGTEFILPNPDVYFPPPDYNATGYVPESAWNDYENPQDGRPLAGGGGVSINFSKPAWQSGPGVPDDNARDVPDVSLVSGDYLPYFVCQADSFGDCSKGQAIGVIGTSLAAPTWAGIQALVNQQNNELGGAGNPDPVFYKLAAGSASPFHDITVGDTLVPDGCFGSSDCSPNMTGYYATPGYDLATGLGSVDVNKLATGWLPSTGTGTATVTLSTGGTATITHGDPLTATVTVSGGGSATPTGDVVLMAATRGVNRITVGSSGSASFTYGPASGVNLPGGAYNLTAHYAGDANFAPANSTPVALTVNPEPTTTQVAADVTGPVSYGVSVRLTAASYGVNTGAAYPVPGTYTFSDGANTLGAATLVGTGESHAFATQGATPSLTTGQTANVLEAGTHQIVASSPAAGASFAASVSAPVTVVVTKSPVLVTLIPNYNTPQVNTSVNLAVNVIPTYEPWSGIYTVAVTGNVDFYDTSTIPETKLGAAALTNRAAALPVTFTTAGLHTVIARYVGDDNNLANSSGAVNITVGTKIPTNTIMCSGLPFTYVPSPIALSAMVTPNSAGAAPTGTMTFTDASANNGAGATIGTAMLNGNRTVTFSTSALAAGTHNVTATYSGDANYAGSTSMAQTISIIRMNLSPSLPSSTVTAGQETPANTLSLSTNSVFTSYPFGDVTLACSGLPAGAACAFASPSIVTSYDSSTGILSGSTTLVVTTTGPTLKKAAMTPSRNPWDGLGPLALAGLLALGLRPRRWRRWFASLAALALLAFALGGCGSGGHYNITNPGTPAGAYPVTVTGTMTLPSGAYTTTATFTVTVTAPGQ